MQDRLLVLWTNGDKTVAMNMVCMYAHNSKIRGWWDNVTLLIWGASGDLLVNDAEVMEKISEMKNAGVEVIACKRCAENMGILERLEAIGVKVFYTGEFLTDWLKSGDRVITI
ncbi:DsrE family protein [Desulfatitalea tepidiphila]|uniref:DsrE family protein n=1 Tax=Desulfatitalea tepidiphila TaxID=1185843 RepID=UPI0006B6476C|nr:DsrE family protein [Desulfatitalea tepidiphila]